MAETDINAAASSRRRLLSAFRDNVIAIVLGVAIAFALAVFGVPGLDPSMWHEVSVTAGVRPPNAIFPGLWRLSTFWIFKAFGYYGALGILKTAGVVGAGIATYLVFMIVRSLLPYLIRTAVNYKVWRNRIVPFFAAMAAVVFGLSDPLWEISQVFSPDLLQLLILLAIVFVSMRYFEFGSRWRLFPVFAAMGIMAAESPFGFLLPVAFAGAYVLLWHLVLNNIIPNRGSLPTPVELPKWRMFFLFLGSLAFGVWLNTAVFASMGGLEANGWSAVDIYFRYMGGYWRVLAHASSIIGWVLGLGFGVFPLVVAAKLFPIAVRDDRPMPFNIGVALFFVGAMAALQCGAFPAARFWTFTREIELVHSGLLLAFFVFCISLTVAVFGSAFAMECQRKYLADDAVKPGPLLRGVVPFLALLLVGLSLMHLRRSVESEMQRIVDDAIAEIVRECGDAKFLFTDGHLDEAVELCAVAEGKTVYALNMMGGASKWETSVRTRGFDPSTEDFKAVETGVPSLLRIWAGEKPQGMKDSALQLGFEFWQRERKELPRASGLLAREYGMSEAEAKRGIEIAKKLSARVLNIAKKADKADCSAELASTFSAVSWRLARMAHLRSDESLANELDLSNSALKRMLSLLEYERLRTFMQLTPREGLQLALKRADFVEARRYSAAVLSYDADDPEANFGMGMSALTVSRYADAEMYLKRVLKRRPDEPAVLNNLSIICRKLGRYKEAEEYARHALKVLPDSKEVKQTLEDALKKAP